VGGDEYVCKVSVGKPKERNQFEYAGLRSRMSRVRVPMRWNFSSFQQHYGPGVDSASNRNEYQEPSLGVKGGWHVRTFKDNTNVDLRVIK
jgi:hypothetical protein